MSEGFKLMTGTWDNLVSVVTMLVDDKVLNSGRGGDFCLCHYILTGSATCQGLYKTSIRGLINGACNLPLSSIWCCQFSECVKLYLPFRIPGYGMFHYETSRHVPILYSVKHWKIFYLYCFKGFFLILHDCLQVADAFVTPIHI
jgi:hypothetical protein